MILIDVRSKMSVSLYLEYEIIERNTPNSDNANFGVSFYYVT